jgi:hypothetical protein
MVDVKVYLFIHELFGIYSQGSGIQLLTPDLSKGCKNPKHTMHKHHTYKMARFKYRTWVQPDIKMRKGHLYRLSGVQPGALKASAVPPHDRYNAHPNRAVGLKDAPYCRWQLPVPSQIYQLRLLKIPNRPLFKGKDGDIIEKQLEAISLVQVFEYEPDGKPIQIIDDRDGRIDMDYGLDEVTNSVNLHLWAQIENEAGMTDQEADEHSQCASAALMSLFNGLDVQGLYSLSTDDWYGRQLEMPKSNAIRFVELMSLSERFALRHVLPQRKGKALKGRQPLGKFEVRCSGKTCGLGSNLFVDAAN